MIKISESIKILLEYKAVSDSDTNTEYKTRILNSIRTPGLTYDQKYAYAAHVAKSMPKLIKQHRINPDDHGKLDSALNLDRINIAKYNDKLYDKNPSLINQIKTGINHLKPEVTNHPIPSAITNHPIPSAKLPYYSPAQDLPALHGPGPYKDQDIHVSVPDSITDTKARFAKSASNWYRNFKGGTFNEHPNENIRTNDMTLLQHITKSASDHPIVTAAAGGLLGIHLLRRRNNNL